ncbi:MAG TPA: FAD-dependent oxidoreductase [Actinophytocola sp.]|uniref:NAD(P)/FAD-dependent oxidoreductase n=1 Tax=Actinophytocola sp. TaxID=1872138 RepID=UPI002DDD5AD0|nr:FAD-dependent oxidoreductase [Actinophytocola sp.]HEV2783566.1 FAD-dependent oxidoreductase [Actinophytocola sp.]
MSDDKRERIVIVGTGAAGLRAGERLRELGFDGELIMVSEEPYRPYHRPALSKQLLTGSVRPRDIVLPVHTELDAVWRYATRATKLDTDERVVHLPGGEEIRYDGLIIATGVQARHLAGAPRHDPRVQVLRTVADAVAVQRAIAHSKGAVAVIGGGFVGCELASAAREMGRDATIITRERELLDKVPGPAVSEMVTGLHRSHGVQLITQASVKHWVPTRDGMALHLSTGQVVLAAVVVLGVGGVPAVDWLRGSGLILDDGIMCGPTCHAVGATDVVVAGDVARWPNLRFDTMPRRIEHWLNAIEMGRAAAENLLVGQANARPYTPLPRFWSDQHGVRIQAAGIPALAQDTVPLAGSVMVGHRVTGYVSEGSLVGVISWDSPRGMLRWSAELDRQSTAAMERRKAVRTTSTPVSTPAPAPRPAPPAGPPTIAIPAVDLSDLWKTRAIPAIRLAGSRPALPPQRPHTEHPSLPSMAPVARNTGHTPASPPRPAEHPSFPSLTPVSRNNGTPAPATDFRPTPPSLESRFAELPPIRPMPPASRTNGHAPVPPPSRPTEHPSFPSMPPVTRTNGTPPASRPTEHPSFPSPPASRTNGRTPVPPSRPTEHPSFPSMPPVTRTNGSPPASRPTEHPSFPSMAPVSRTNGTPPASRPTAHPSFPSMPPVSRTNGRAPVPPPSRPTEHPSFPSMPPVSRINGTPPAPRPTEHPSFPSPPASRTNGRTPVPPSRPTEHPSFPSMPPVSRTNDHPVTAPMSRITDHQPTPPSTTNGRTSKPPASRPPASRTNGRAPRPPASRHNGDLAIPAMSQLTGQLPTTPPESPTNGRTPRPPASRSNGRATPPPPRSNDRTPTPPRYTEHPSFPSMAPVSPPYEQHPSFPPMASIPPPSKYLEHPSLPSMRPVPRYTEHPSFPSMAPVSRASDPRFDELFVRDADLPGMRVPDLPPIDLRAVIR